MVAADARTRVSGEVCAVVRVRVRVWQDAAFLCCWQEDGVLVCERASY